jgi:hypothetical protein
MRVGRTTVVARGRAWTELARPHATLQDAAAY